MSVYVIRAFIKQRELLRTHTQILKKDRPDRRQLLKHDDVLRAIVHDFNRSSIRHRLRRNVKLASANPEGIRLFGPPWDVGEAFTSCHLRSPTFLILLSSFILRALRPPRPLTSSLPKACSPRRAAGLPPSPGRGRSLYVPSSDF